MKLYFGIHKHMHQPYYRAADTGYWDGEKEGIFGSRCGNYTSFIPEAIQHYINGALPHAGISSSWSGSLIEQLNRCSRDNLCNGCFKNWENSLRSISQELTTDGNRRLSFTAFGFYHPLIPLIPERDIIRQITFHREIIKKTFGVEASDTLFPPETAFHVRMIPALKKAGINAVIYDSIHRYRTCKDYPYAGMSEGMLPPNPADQVNPAVNDWVQLHGIWAGSKISPSLLKPEYVRYEDIDGTIQTIIAIPAERYIGNEDGRGGYGALQYEHVLGQVYQNILDHNSYDPKHPPFFLLHSDGDNHGGGADSYYHHNTERLVNWIKNDPRFELTTIDDYLKNFPPDKNSTVHIEPGSWSGADNGDPQFRKWFSMYEQPYSPDLNSWAILTSLQNCIHSLEDAHITGPAFDNALRLLLTAETSCYWYWTGQEIWDRQVTEAANAALSQIKPLIDSITATDKTGPTIFAPWVTPENPGGLTWGQGCLKPAEKTATVHTFVSDINGLDDVRLVLRTAQKEQVLQMNNRGPYPSRTNPAMIANYYTIELPQKLGDVRFYVEAVDVKGNVARSTLERVFLA
ncbi:MAG: glycosyl hydrolase family 57 [Fibrobacter sp.]|nr:glycosyl hydrolase family 57 [Fibrobacter sp.]